MEAFQKYYIIKAGTMPTAIMLTVMTMTEAMVMMTMTIVTMIIILVMAKCDESEWS